ncbi:WhiB family transcriptional regulator [Actinacidiphila glaucinigra]|uniref:WhiB family transcriptional regulator n=1 Tax=Actinacidiphila glaucinigra TaxID=235986 RepID=UPI0035DE7FB6
MSQSGTPRPLAHEADPRIPFPHSTTPTACRAEPELFAYERGGSTSADFDARVDMATAACSACPLASGCLKWALANPDLTQTGIWAATTPRQRCTLRQRLIARLGPDWVAVVAERDRQRATADRLRVLVVPAQPGTETAGTGRAASFRPPESSPEHTAVPL